MSNSGIVKIHGKDYKTVALRVAEFRSAYPSYGINTEILKHSDGQIIIKATVCNDKEMIIGTGIAHEVEGSTNINKTSYVENCETSAIGRALACIGLSGTDSYASANEVTAAIINQAVKDSNDKIQRHNQAVRESLQSILVIKDSITTGDLSTASEAWYELDKDVMTDLWVSPSAGGIFTTSERDTMKSSEFRKSHFGEH
jgi:hypothetical protein|tara:strand:- start:1701 stop:2300 length:600 start_codon:yes stop_codon:yes gene_type:complete